MTLRERAEKLSARWMAADHTGLIERELVALVNECATLAELWTREPAHKAPGTVGDFIRSHFGVKR